MSISSTYPAFLQPDAARRRAFQRAKRHTRLVRWLRILLPVAGGLTILVLLVATQLRLPLSVDLAGARLSVTPNGIVMDNPHLTGFDQGGRHYSVQADRAVQSLASPNQVQLENITASIAMAAHGTATVVAAAGNYDNTEGTLNLSGGITIDSSEGYRLRMEDAAIDFGLGTLTSSNPVTIGYQDSETSGASLQVSESGAVIILEGDVRTLIMPPKRQSAASANP